MVCRGPFVLLAVLYSLIAAPAEAQDAPTAVTAEDEVRTILAEAVMEYGAAHYAEAHALFQRAHALRPGARTLRGIGMTAFELRHYVDSVLSLAASLEEPARALTDEQRVQVEALLERARRFVGRYQLEVTPANATVTVDGHSPRTQPDGRILLDLGSHTIVGDCEHCSPRTIRLEVTGGEDEVLELALESESEPPPDDPVTTVVQVQEVGELTPPPSDAAVSDEDSSAVSSASWGALGMGGALLLGGVATGVLALQAKGDLDDECRTRSTCPTSLRGTRNSARRLSIATDVLWVSGAAFLAAGVLWRLLGGGEDSEPPAVAMCGAGGCVVLVRSSL